MRIIHDPDEFEPKAVSRPCTVCNGDMTKCNGGCNGSASFTLVRRDPAEVKRIKAEKERMREDDILAQAEIIKSRRLR